MRGTRNKAYFDKIKQRIIPAYAGNTEKQKKRPNRRQDHPRVCGEHGFDGAYSTIKKGSSPRMRGTLNVRCECFIRFRIIPAYAGNTDKTIEKLNNAKDHPRVCGEHLKIYRRILMCIGSSPRMRGTLE